jgi:anthranilate synthase/phosphoribosyltransferase
MEILNGGGRKTIKSAVCLNAGAVLYIAGKARTIRDGFDMAKEAIDSFKAKRKLEEIVEVSNSF